MSKLLGYYFRRDKWLLLAIAAVPILASLLYLFFSEDVAAGMNIVSGYIAWIVCAFALYIRDYKRFYGTYSDFFSGLPLTGKEIIGARLIWFVLIDLYGMLVFGLKIFTVARRVLDPAIYTEMMTDFHRTVAQLHPRVIVIFIIASIVSLLFTSIIWLFVTSVGSEKKFRRFGIGGPIMLYVGVQIIYVVVAKIIERVAPTVYESHVMDGMNDMQYLIGNINNAMFTMIAIATILLAVGDVLMYVRSVRSHDHKLSTYS
ncbi:MAG: hypothetical protein PUG99_04560 [Firmicutes bacterium]|nr:hypothetical protein [Bacillota bacterium]